MRQIFRLLRFGLPYWLHWFPGVLLLAAVGLLEALRMAFFVPILGVVLRPSNPSSALPCGEVDLLQAIRRPVPSLS